MPGAWVPLRIRIEVYSVRDTFQETRRLNYEHLIQINDPLNPLVENMTSEQLWQGLMLRAEQPQLFVPGLERCRLTARTDNGFERELHYGNTVVHDRVVLIEGRQVRYEIAPTPAYVGGSLSMTIEQPDDLQLFLRFEYRTTLQETESPHQDLEAHRTQEIVKSAYREADIDTVRLIRQFMATGALPGLPH
jgi:hypothetical protein